MICQWCECDNGKTGQSVEARFCSYCGRYGPDESVVDPLGWCDRCGYTGNEIVCPTCGAQLDPEPIDLIDEALELQKHSDEPLEDDDIPF
jgi:methionyl-tRNA synthetase